MFFWGLLILYGSTGSYWIGSYDSHNWEKSGFSDLVSREDWILLVELLLQYNHNVVDSAIKQWCE